MTTHAHGRIDQTSMNANAHRPDPFDLDDEPTYRRWRAAKLAAAPRAVEPADPS